MMWFDYILKHESIHFIFSACVGLLGYLLMLTMYLAYRKLYGWVTYGSSFSPRAVRIIQGTLILASLCLALWAHSALDSALDWYVTPLGPPLDIK